MAEDNIFSNFSTENSLRADVQRSSSVSFGGMNVSGKVDDSGGFNSDVTGNFAFAQGDSSLSIKPKLGLAQGAKTAADAEVGSNSLQVDNSRPTLDMGVGANFKQNLGDAGTFGVNGFVNKNADFSVGANYARDLSPDTDLSFKTAYQQNDGVGSFSAGSELNHLATNDLQESLGVSLGSDGSKAGTTLGVNADIQKDYQLGGHSTISPFAGLEASKSMASPSIWSSSAKAGLAYTTGGGSSVDLTVSKPLTGIGNKDPKVGLAYSGSLPSLVSPLKSMWK